MKRAEGPWSGMRYGRRLILPRGQPGRQLRRSLVPGRRHVPQRRDWGSTGIRRSSAARSPSRRPTSLPPLKRWGLAFLRLSDDMGGHRTHRVRACTIVTTSTIWSPSCARPVSTACLCSSTRTRTCGAGSAAAMAHRDGPWRPLGSSCGTCTLPGRRSCIRCTAIRCRA